jgi:ATP-dependent helicase IRC3
MSPCGFSSSASIHILALLVVEGRKASSNVTRVHSCLCTYFLVWSMPWPLLNRISCTLRRFSTSSTTASAAVSKNEPVTLRPYQEEALKACTDALARGVSRIGVSLPTGSGKTTVFLSLLSRISPPSTKPEATRALVIVNAVELARQSAAQARRLFPEWTVEIEQGAKYKATGEADL